MGRLVAAINVASRHAGAVLCAQDLPAHTSLGTHQRLKEYAGGVLTQAQIKFDALQTRLLAWSNNAKRLISNSSLTSSRLACSVSARRGR